MKKRIIINESQLHLLQESQDGVVLGDSNIPEYTDFSVQNAAPTHTGEDEDDDVQVNPGPTSDNLNMTNQTWYGSQMVRRR